MILTTNVTQPSRIRTVVEAKKQVVEVSTPSSPIKVTQVTQGITGASGDKNNVHEQGAAAATWTINHNLGKYPAVTIVDSAGDEVEGMINHVSLNQVVITFSAAFSGRAFIN